MFLKTKSFFLCIACKEHIFSVWISLSISGRWHCTLHCKQNMELLHPFFFPVRNHATPTRTKTAFWTARSWSFTSFASWTLRSWWDLTSMFDKIKFLFKFLFENLEELTKIILRNSMRFGKIINGFFFEKLWRIKEIRTSETLYFQNIHKLLFLNCYDSGYCDVVVVTIKYAENIGKPSSFFLPGD